MFATEHYGRLTVLCITSHPNYPRQSHCHLCTWYRGWGSSTPTSTLCTRISPICILVVWVVHLVVWPARNVCIGRVRVGIPIIPRHYSIPCALLREVVVRSWRACMLSVGMIWTRSRFLAFFWVFLYRRCWGIGGIERYSLRCPSRTCGRERGHTWRFGFYVRVETPCICLNRST